MKCSLGISNFLEEISSFFPFYCFPLILCTEVCLIIFYIWWYTYFNAILSNHPTLTFSHSQKVCFYICVFFVALRIWWLLLSFLIPYTWVNIMYWCFSFGLTYCIIGSSFILSIITDSNVFFFNSWVISHCVYEPQLPYPFVFQRISRLFLCPSYRSQYCNEHWSTYISYNSGFLSMLAHQWDCWVIRQLDFQVFKASPQCSP